MEVKVNSSELLKRLEQVVKVVASKSVMQILDDVMFEVRGNVMVLTASDSETWLSVKCPILEASDGMRFCVNAKDFMELIKNIADKELTLSVEEDTSQLLCDYGNGQFSMPYDAAEEYPAPVSSGGGMISVLVDGKKIHKAIELTLVGVGNSITRPIMNGINFKFGEDGMTVSSTNTHKIIQYKDKSVVLDGAGGFTIPKKPSIVLLSILASIEGEVKLSFDGSSISANNSDFKMSARLIEGAYPNCRSVMPTDNKVVVSIDKGSILQALKRVSPMTSEVSDLVVLSFNDGYVTISADNAMFGKSASETVACNCDGEIKIGFKGSDLAEMIKNIDDDNIIISLSTPKSGALITAASTYSQDEYISMLAPSLIGQNG